MSDDDDDPALERALGSLPPPQARPGFRSDLRSRFVHADAEPAALPDATAPRRRAAEPRSPLARRLPLWLGLAAASVAAFFLIRGEAAPPPGWEVLDQSYGELVYVNGSQHSPEWETDLQTALREGGRVRTTATSGLHLRFGDDLALFIGPESRVVLPRSPSGGDAPRFDLLTESGHLSVATGPDFAGSTLQVFTPDTEVEVVGTSFAVDVDDKGTCVCCRSGTVRVRPLASAADEDQPVEAGNVGFVFPDGRLARQAGTMAEHVKTLDALRSSW